jgi:hypothetical protein
MVRELREAVETVSARDDVRVVVLAGPLLSHPPGVESRREPEGGPLSPGGEDVDEGGGGRSGFPGAVLRRQSYAPRPVAVAARGPGG